MAGVGVIVVTVKISDVPLNLVKMKAKIKSNNKILFSEGSSNKWDKITDSMIINFMNKNTYNSFKQLKEHLLIDTTEGEIDIVFTGEVPKLEFDNFCKDQLVLKVVV